MGARFSRERSTRPPTATVEQSTGVPVLVGMAVPVPAAAAPDHKKAAGDKKDGAQQQQQLDLVFTMDCTGSMGSYIQAAKRNIQAIAERLVQSEGYDLRFALVAYRDHPPQDMTYVTKKFEFTAEVEQMKRDLSTLSAQGGGDGPEAVAAGLKETLDCDWRPNATKVCILIADAPPHGLGESGDGFANGAPDGVDPFGVLTQMSMRGICIYSVGCEPALSSYNFAKEFFVAAAQKTNGQAVSLRSSAALADVIMGGAIEEMDLQQLADEVVEEVRQMRAARPAAARGDRADGDYDSEEERTVAWEAVQNRGHTTRHMKTKKLKAKNAGVVLNAASLAEARDTLKSVAPAAPKKTGMRTKTRAKKCCGVSGARPLPRLPPLSMAKSGTGSVRTRLGDDHHLEKSNFDTEFSTEALDTSCASPRIFEPHASDSDYSGSDSDSDEEEGEEGAAAGGVRLERRSLSFGQVKRIYGRSKAMGLL